MEIEQYNKLIAEFMGYKVYNKRYPRNHGIGGNIIDTPKECILQKLKFHKDWNILMLVVEKVEFIYSDFHGHFAVYISGNSCVIQGTKLFKGEPPREAYFNDCYSDTKIEATYAAIVEFIIWYNKNKESI